jgi:hypothetical protein
MHKNNNKRIEFSTGKMGYFFHNFIRYETFILATYETVLLHCMMYGETLVGLGSWLAGTGVTTKRFFSASFHFSVGAKSTVPFYLPIMRLN